ncbi:SDR family oxidoreductase [bacterium]|nr:SDR family oxidoreductase [bacterium]
MSRPIALITGVGRSVGIGAAVASRLVTDGWDVVTTGWRQYDERMPWGPDTEPLAMIEADLADPGIPADLVGRIAADHGPIAALVMCHAESVDSSTLDTTVESFDRHFAVNARAVWLLIKAYAEQFAAAPGLGRIVALTSDHTPFNLPYGASKGALDRIVLAAAVELADRGITANVINPGATETGWMDEEIEQSVLRRNLQPRVGTPGDCANLVSFLCSDEGGWVNGQVLFSDGGRLH